MTIMDCVSDEPNTRKWNSRSADPPCSLIIGLRSRTFKTRELRASTTSGPSPSTQTGFPELTLQSVSSGGAAMRARTSLLLANSTGTTPGSSKTTTPGSNRNEGRGGVESGERASVNHPPSPSSLPGAVSHPHKTRTAQPRASLNRERIQKPRKSNEANGEAWASRFGA